jgi:hypothetical protein
MPVPLSSTSNLKDLKAQRGEALQRITVLIDSRPMQGVG